MSHFARRTLSLLLAITMVAGMLPMGVFAAEAENSEQPTPVVETVTPESSDPAPSESETPAESSDPAPSESETPAESGEPNPSESETPAESGEPTASEPETEETTLPTETQEDAPKGRTLTGENEPCLTAFDVSYNLETGRWEEDSSGEAIAFGFGAGTDSYKIFYYNTYDAETETWTSVPVVPAPGPYLTVTSLNDLENMDTAGDNADYYVRLSAVSTLDAQDTYVEFESAKMDVTIVKMTTGFFTSETPSWDTYIKDDFQLDASKSENAAYWIYRGDDAPADVSPDTYCTVTGEMLQSYFGEGTDTAPVTFDKVSDNVYKLTINPKLVTLSKYDDSIFLSTTVSCTDADGNTLSHRITFQSDENVLPSAEIEINDGAYCFYNDGAVWYGYWDESSYVTVPVSVDGFVYTPDEAIKLNGVSYDYDSNTLTLNNAVLDRLALSSYDNWVVDGEVYPDQRLPNNNLTLNLVGSNIIREELQIRSSACVTLVGEGTLTMKGGVGVYGEKSTLDMATNHIILDRGSWTSYADESVNGDFWYVDGYTELRVAELYRDADGVWLMGSHANTAQCVFTALDSHSVVFYLYTSKKNDDGTYGWDVQPVIPEGGEYWTITPIPEDIKDGATDSDYYVTLRTQGTLGDVEDVLSYDGIQYKMYVRASDGGFFTQPEWNVSYVLPSQDVYNLSADGNNTIYLVPGTGVDIKDVEWSLNRADLNASEMFTATKLDSGAYKIDFTNKCFDYTDLVLLGNVSFSYNGSEWTGTWNKSLALVPPADTGDSGSGEESDATLAAQFFVCIDGTWNTYEYYTDGTTRGDIIDGFSYDQGTNTLTLTNVDLTWFDLVGEDNLTNKNLTLVLAGENKIGEMSVNMGTNLTIRGEGTLDIGSHLYVDLGGHLILEGVDKVYLPNPSALRVDTNVSTVTGTFSYREGTSYIAVRELGQNETGFYLENETYRPIAESGIMGMQEAYRIFYSCVYQNGEWVMTPVIPTVSEAPERLSVTKCTDVTATGLTEAEKAAVVKVQSLDLGGYGSGKSRAYLTINGEDYDFTLYDLHIAYYSSVQPTPETYLADNAQHFFDSNGDSFYCIIRTTATGIAIRGDVTWKFNTWGQDYSFIPGIEKNEDLVVIEDLSYDDSGNRVFKITPSEAWVDFTRYGYNWKNFSIAPVVTWEYTGNPGEMGFSDYWEIWINPPTNTQWPEVLLTLGETDYQFYADGAVYCAVIDGDYEYKKLATLPDGVTYDGDTNTLTLDGANLPGLVIRDDGESYHLNIHVASDSTISSVRIHGRNSITVTHDEDASLTVTDELCVFDATRLELTDYAVTLGENCKTEIWGTIEGELAFAEGYAQVILYALWNERLEDENGNAILDDNGNEQYLPALHGPYTLEEYCLTGMYSQTLLFYSKVMGENGWEMTPVVPGSSDLEFTAYEGSFQHEDSAFLRNVTCNTLGDHRVILTVEGKDYEWYVAPTPVGYFSGPEATVENYLKGDSQYFFDTTVDGENTFYFIALAGKCGYTLNGDITWQLNTWNETYSDFIPGIESDEELVSITPCPDDANGNKVWKITVSDAYVNYVKYSYNWKNFCLLISASWTYSDGNTGGIDGYGMFINPPQEQVSPKAAFCIDNAEYFIYEDDAIFCRDWNNGGNFVKITEEDYPAGVSYDVNTNTMTLDNASLEMLYLEYDNSWYDEDGTFHESHMLPSDTVTLNLVGENTLENDYANGIELAGGANLEIIGGGTLNIHVTNHFEQVPEEYGGGVVRYAPVFLSGTSSLTIGGSAAVTLVSDYDTETLGEWLFGIDSEGGTSSLTLKDSATLNIQMPEGEMFKYNEDGSYGFLSIQTNPDPKSGLCAITIQDNAILTTDSMNLSNCVYTQTGGTWNLYTNPTNAQGRGHDGLYAENATLNISGGELNIIGRYADETGLEDFTFYGIQLAEGSQMNVSGGTVNVHNTFSRGFGIYNAPQTGLNVTGGTINLLSEKPDVVYFNALAGEYDPSAIQFQMNGGTINADGRIFAVMDMSDGEINLTGMPQSTLPSMMMVHTGSITGGKINLSNAIFINGMNFSIDGGVIDICNTDDTTGLGDEAWPLVGLSNQMYLPINGGTITIQTANAPAIENYGTFHQMGGTITATSNTDGVANNGKMLLNSGTLELSGDRGVNQWFDAELEGEDGEIFVPVFQVGGGTGDHHLTITSGNIGLLAMGGQVQFTGQAQVDITIPEDGTVNGEVAGIDLFDGTDGVCPAELTIEGAANVDIQCLLDSGVGLYSASPVSIIGNQEVCPTISIQAKGSAVFFRNNQEELDLLTMEGLEFVTADSGRKLNSWSHENRIGDNWYHYLMEGDAYATYVTTRANTTFAEFTICPASDFRHSYRVTEQDGQQLVEVKDWNADDSEYAPGELPEGIAYDLATNTMTLSNKKAIEWLQVAYLVKDEYGNDVPCLPSQDFTIKLKKSCSIYMLSLEGQINATITGSGTLKLMDSASINGELTIAKGVTLVNDVAIAARGIASTEYHVGGPTKLTIAKGATLTNNGLLIVDGQENSTVDIQGKFSQGSKGQTWISWDQRENVNIAKSLQTLICDITTETELTAIRAEETLSKYKQVRIYVSSMELTGEHNIPKNTSLRISDGCTLTIGETADVAIAGTLVLDEYDTCTLQNNGTLRIAKGGTMSMNGNFYGIAPVNEGGKITPQASKLKITAEDNVTSFDLFYMDELTTTLTVAVTTKDTKVPLNRVTWKSSNEKIVKAADILDKQDGTYRVTFAGGVGKVTLTATTIDGIKKTATVNLTVAYLDGKLTATQEGSYSDKFLQVDETATMAVTVGEISLNDLNAALETNVVTFKSSNAKVATVDPETGVITGIKAGTAKITATMAIPGDKRTVSINVKVVVPQILQLRLREGVKNEDKTITSTGELYSYEEGVEGNTTFDLSTFNGKAKDLYIFPESLTWSAEGNSDYEPAVANKLKWTCSDTSIATVKANKDYATVTVKAKAHGVFTITATATDTNKAVTTMTFIVMDYKPRLSNPSITLNPKQEGGVKLDLVESYGNTIYDVWLEGKNADSLTIDTDTNRVEAVGELKNQTIKPTLVVDTVEGVYEIPLTVTIKNSTPKITVTQYDKLELGYIGGTHIDVTSSIGEVYRVELAEDSSPDILLKAWYYHDDGYHTEYDSETEYNYVEFSLQTSDNCGSPINTKVKLKVYVTGYQVPIDYSFTPKTTTTKITVTSTPTASVINGNAAEYTASFGLKTTAQGDTWDLEIWGDEIKDYLDDYHTTVDDVYLYGWKAQVLKVTYNNTELPFEVVDNTIRLTFSKDEYPKGFNGTVKVEIRYPYWSQHKTISHKISTSTKAPTVTTEKSTLTLYSLFPERYAWTTASLNQSNLTLDSIDTPTCTNKEGQKLYMETYVPGDTGVAYINAYFNQNEDGSYIIPKDGTYTFNTVAHYTDPVTEATKDVKFSFKVKVTSTSPTVKLSSNTIKLNTALAGNEEEGKPSQEEGYVYAKITYNDAWTLSNNGYLDLVGYEVDGHKVFFPQESYDEYGEPVETESTTYEDEKHGIRFRAQQYYHDALYNEGCNGVLFAELTRKTATKRTYTVYPIVHEYTTDTEYTLYKNKLSLTVQPHSGKLSVTQSASGKLDLLTMDTSVIYTIKKVNNAYCDDLQVTLLKKDGKDYVPYETDEDGNYTEAPLFDLYVDVITQSGKNYQAVYLWLNQGYAYTAGKTEQFKFRYTIGDVSFDSPVLSLKINRSTPTITAPTVNYYHAEGIADKTVQLNLTKPAGAYIDRVEFNEKKTSKELLAAMEEINPVEDWNWENDTLTISIVNPGALKAGKSYNLYLDVYPLTPPQTAEKPTTVKVTVKVAK